MPPKIRGLSGSQMKWSHLVSDQWGALPPFTWAHRPGVLVLVPLVPLVPSVPLVLLFCPSCSSSCPFCPSCPLLVPLVPLSLVSSSCPS